MMMWCDDDWGWGGWVLTTAAMVVFWALAITAIVLLARYLVSSRRGAKLGAGPKSAENLLAERYARGDIDDEEYRRRQTLLRQNN
jgi:putative membrane protein